jgi:2'-5' RNA ligase
MNTTTPQYSLFPETVYEYFILLSPSDEIKEEVDRRKDLLNEMIGIDPADLKSIAHISLITYVGMDSMNIPDIVRKAVAGTKAFTVKINGHDFFKNGDRRTLYLKIENPEPIQHLAELLKPQPKRAHKKNTSPKPIIPHITIAKNIHPEELEKIEDLSVFGYEGEWLCNRITVLRRPMNTNRHFSPVTEILLG